MLVVVHVPARVPSALPKLLARLGTLAVRHAVDGEPLARRTILVAPPDRHLLVEGDRVRLGIGPLENGLRPAADPLFRTAANAHGRRVVGVVLSGALDDGTRGLAIVKERGGVAIVQSQDEARFRGMPRSALDNVDVDHVLPAKAIARRLHALAGGAEMDGADGRTEMARGARRRCARSERPCVSSRGENGIGGERAASL